MTILVCRILIVSVIFIHSSHSAKADFQIWMTGHPHQTHAKMIQTAITLTITTLVMTIQIVKNIWKVIVPGIQTVIQSPAQAACCLQRILVVTILIVNRQWKNLVVTIQIVRNIGRVIVLGIQTVILLPVQAACYLWKNLVVTTQIVHSQWKNLVATIQIAKNIGRAIVLGIQTVIQSLVQAACCLWKILVTMIQHIVSLQSIYPSKTPVKMTQTAIMILHQLSFKLKILQNLSQF